MARDARALMFCWVLALTACNRSMVDDGVGDQMVGQKPGAYEAYLKGAPAPAVTGPMKGLPADRTSAVPQENLVESPAPPIPDLETEDLARAFVGGVGRGEHEKAMTFAIPVALMVRIRDMHMTELSRARVAARKLALKTRARIARTVQRLIKRGKMKDATFESIALGSCKFITKGADWNRYAFWRCTGSSLFYHVEGERKSLKIKEMINWGAKWYIVRL